MITRNLLQRPAALALFALSACAVAFSVEAADTKPNNVIMGATKLVSPMSALRHQTARGR